MTLADVNSLDAIDTVGCASVSTLRASVVAVPDGRMFTLSATPIPELVDGLDSPVFPDASDSSSDVINEIQLGVRAGMSTADYITLQGGAYAVEVSANDAAHGCRQNVDLGSDNSITPFTTWVWARDGTIQTVGVPGSEDLVRISFGPNLGGALDPADDSLSG